MISYRRCWSGQPDRLWRSALDGVDAGGVDERVFVMFVMVCHR